MTSSITEIPVLIVGGGSVGLATAIELGSRNIACIVLEQNERPAAHPRATALNARSMEFMRRWGIADKIKAAAAPPDFPHTALYCTALNGFEIARVERPDHGSGRSNSSPESAQRCNQIWTDPILCEAAQSFASVDVRFRWRFIALDQAGDEVHVTARNEAAGETVVLRAQYVIDCTGAHTPIRRGFGIEMTGGDSLTHHISAFVRAPELWTHHDKGKAALINFVEPGGIWRNLVSLNGRDLYRFGIRGKEYYDAPESVDVAALFRQIAGPKVPFEVVSVNRWTARNVVADRYQVGRVLLAGDAAHLNHPASGLGLNTGLGDATNIGWKLAAVLDGWGGSSLIESYGTERRAIAVRNVGHAERMNTNDRSQKPPADIAEASAAGAAARKALGDRISAALRQKFITTGLALGYVYDGSPICAPGGEAAPPESITEYVPSTYPGARAPHAWLGDGRSTLDLYGNGFVLMAFAPDEATAVGSLAAALDARKAPLLVQHVADPEVRALYQRDLVLVRPDGHVAWRGDRAPADAKAIADRVCGAV